MATTRYFAYGSNMDSSTLCGRRGIHYLRATAGVVRGWRLALDKPSLLGLPESMATIVADEAAEVWGVLYEIAAADLEHLELTEGVLLGHYQNIQVLVDPRPSGNGISSPPVDAMTLASDHRDPSLRPSRRYMGLLLAGALEHGLPSQWVEHLRSVDAVEESPQSLAMRGFIDSVLSRQR
ncbi:MAG TPA: gamma-glutamylcyclotransferase [Candidatus Binatia bacterium]